MRVLRVFRVERPAGVRTRVRRLPLGGSRLNRSSNREEVLSLTDAPQILPFPYGSWGATKVSLVAPSSPNSPPEALEYLETCTGGGAEVRHVVGRGGSNGNYPLDGVGSTGLQRNLDFPSSPPGHPTLGDTGGYPRLGNSSPEFRICTPTTCTGCQSSSVRPVVGFIPVLGRFPGRSPGSVRVSGQPPESVTPARALRPSRHTPGISFVVSPSQTAGITTPVSVPPGGPGLRGRGRHRGPRGTVRVPPPGPTSASATDPTGRPGTATRHRPSAPVARSLQRRRLLCTSAGSRTGHPHTGHSRTPGPPETPGTLSNLRLRTARVLRVSKE